MNNAYKILVVNPGSTSDEISYFEGDTEIFHKTVRYSPKDLEPYETQQVTSQFSFRASLVQKTLEEAHVDLNTLDAIIGRGGLLRPIPSGTYAVDDLVLQDLIDGVGGDHPSNLGGIIAHHMAKDLGIPAFIADPVVVDEMEPVARFSGMPENPRISIFHALNQKRVARLAAAELGKPYQSCDLIVLHGGGGITVGAHHHGRVIDVNNGLDGEGPFTPQRSGSVPAGGLVKMCFSKKYSLTDMKLKIKGHGGLVAYLGTSDLLLIENYLDGKTLTDEEKSSLLPHVTPEFASLCIEAMAYQISKEICSHLATFKGHVDAIVLTGGIVRDKRLVEWIKS
ncbi:butyrate kinase, partial [bacterium]|nr:butyrate kinase [candidate division CSSED10-310 bacterium]